METCFQESPLSSRLSWTAYLLSLGGLVFDVEDKAGVHTEQRTEDDEDEAHPQEHSAPYRQSRATK